MMEIKNGCNLLTSKRCTGNFEKLISDLMMKPNQTHVGI